MKKKILIIVGVILILLVGVVGFFYSFNPDEEKIDSDVSYAISFKGSKENETYYTYFYVKDDSYYYVQVVSTKNEEESTYVNEVTDSDYFYNPSEIIEIASSNKSFDLITINMEIGDYSKGDVITEDELKVLLDELEIYEK